MSTFRYQDNCENIPWNRVPELLEIVGMSFVNPELHQKSFELSYSVLFVFDEDKLIGFGRIISDGVRHSAVYDIAVDPAYQGQKIGQEIVSRLIRTTPNCTFILYAAVGKEGFYQKLGFSKMKTGMARFSNPQLMVEKGFIEG